MSPRSSDVEYSTFFFLTSQLVLKSVPSHYGTSKVALSISSGRKHIVSYVIRFIVRWFGRIASSQYWKKLCLLVLILQATLAWLSSSHSSTLATCDIYDSKSNGVMPGLSYPLHSIWPSWHSWLLDVSLFFTLAMPLSPGCLPTSLGIAAQSPLPTYLPHFQKKNK